MAKKTSGAKVHLKRGSQLKKTYDWLMKHADSNGTVDVTPAVRDKLGRDVEIKRTPNINRKLLELSRAGLILYENGRVRGRGKLVTLIGSREATIRRIEYLRLLSKRAAEMKDLAEVKKHIDEMYRTADLTLAAF
jgi:hypothetical protein